MDTFRFKVYRLMVYVSGGWVGVDWSLCWVACLLTRTLAENQSHRKLGSIFHEILILHRTKNFELYKHWL